MTNGLLIFITERSQENHSLQPKQKQMVKLALLARLEAKPGKEKEVIDLLKNTLSLAQAESATGHWFALELGPATFGIFNSLEQEKGRKAHLSGSITAALMARAPELLAQFADVRGLQESLR
jgi:quinol monooxygenase YgiN